MFVVHIAIKSKFLKRKRRRFRHNSNNQTISNTASVHTCQYTDFIDKYEIGNKVGDLGTYLFST